MKSRSTQHHAVLVIHFSRAELSFQVTSTKSHCIGSTPGSTHIFCHLRPPSPTRWTWESVYCLPPQILVPVPASPRLWCGVFTSLLFLVIFPSACQNPLQPQQPVHSRAVSLCMLAQSPKYLSHGLAFKWLNVSTVFQCMCKTECLQRLNWLGLQYAALPMYVLLFLARSEYMLLKLIINISTC